MFSSLFFLATAYSGVFFFQPSILSNGGRFSMSVSALLNSVPFMVATPLALLNASVADRSGRNLRYVVFGQALAAAGMLATAIVLRGGAPALPLELASLTLIEIGVECFYTPFVAFQGTMLSESVAATGYAVINMGGATGFSVGPSIVGSLRRSTDSFSLSFLALGALAGVSLCMTLTLLAMARRRTRVERAIEMT